MHDKPPQLSPHMPPMDGDIARQLISPPPEEELELTRRAHSRSNSQTQPFGSSQSNTNVATSKRKRTTQTGQNAPPALSPTGATEVTPNPKPRKFSRKQQQHLDESPTRARSRSRSRTPVVPYEPPTEVYESPREIILPAPGAKTRRKGKAGNKTGLQISTPPIKVESPPSVFHTRPETPTPGEDELLLIPSSSPTRKSSRSVSTPPRMHNGSLPPSSPMQLSSPSSPLSPTGSLPHVDSDGAEENDMVLPSPPPMLRRAFSTNNVSHDMDHIAAPRPAARLPEFDLGASEAEYHTNWSSSPLGGEDSGEYQETYKETTMPLATSTSTRPAKPSDSIWSSPRKSPHMDVDGRSIRDVLAYGIESDEESEEEVDIRDREDEEIDVEEMEEDEVRQMSLEPEEYHRGSDLNVADLSLPSNQSTSSLGRAFDFSSISPDLNTSKGRARLIRPNGQRPSTSLSFHSDPLSQSQSKAIHTPDEFSFTRPASTCGMYQDQSFSVSVLNASVRTTQSSPGGDAGDISTWVAPDTEEKPFTVMAPWDTPSRVVDPRNAKAKRVLVRASAPKPKATLEKERAPRSSVGQAFDYLKGLTTGRAKPPGRLSRAVAGAANEDEKGETEQQQEEQPKVYAPHGDRFIDFSAPLRSLSSSTAPLKSTNLESQKHQLIIESPFATTNMSGEHRSSIDQEVDNSDSEDESDESLDLEMVKITSNDPKAAAKAAAILKLYNYDLFTKPISSPNKKRRRHSYGDQLKRKPSPLSGEGVTKSVSPGRKEREERKRRRATLGGVVPDSETVVLSDGKTSSLRDLVDTASASVKAQKRHGSASVPKDSVSVAPKEGEARAIEEWTKKEWRLLDSCFTDERIVLAGGKSEDVVDVGEVQSENVVRRFLEYDDHTSHWESDKDTLFKRVEALRRKQGEGNGAPPTPRTTLFSKVRREVGGAMDAPEFTPLPSKSARGRIPRQLMATPTPAFPVLRKVSPVEYNKAKDPPPTMFAPRYSHLMEEAVKISNEPQTTEDVGMEDVSGSSGGSGDDGSMEQDLSMEQPSQVDDEDQELLPKAPPSVSRRLSSYIISYLPTFSSKASSSKIPKRVHGDKVQLPLPPPEILNKPRGPVVTPARPALPKEKPHKDQVDLHHTSPQKKPAAKSGIPKPKRMVDLNHVSPPKPVDERPAERPVSRAGSVRDRVKFFSEIEERSREEEEGFMSGGSRPGSRVGMNSRPASRVGGEKKAPLWKP